jgi:chromosome segregation ATPase
MTDREFEEYLARDIERRKWSEGALERVQALQAVKRDTAEAVKVRDAALAERDRLVKDAAAKKARFEREAAAALTDLNAVLTAKMQTAEAELETARRELTAVKAQTVQAREAKAEAVAGHQRALTLARDEMTEIQSRLERLRAEERGFRERLAAALK